jgi:hypothetical protein
LDNPGVRSGEDWPTKEELSKELKELQQLLDAPNEQWFLQIPGMMRIARSLCPAERDIESLRDALALAVARIGANRWADSISLLYGLDAETEGEGLDVRQQRAFEVSGESSPNTFRQSRRKEMAMDLADCLLELVANPGSAGEGDTGRKQRESRSQASAFWRGGDGYMPVWQELGWALAIVFVVFVGAKLANF